MKPTDEAFRDQLRAVLERSGLSMRALSAVMSRDSGYVAALLDPGRPSRARPNPEDLLRAADATGIAFVELVEALWGIDRARLADELARLGSLAPFNDRLATLSAAEQASLADYAAFLAARHRAHGQRPRSDRRAAPPRN
ncbi:MAG TPA: hypothetical protein VIM30_15410 [Candidatus Limnocylindrales bacterium]